MLTTKKASEKYPIPQGTLKNACARGDIEATKYGNAWVTTDKAILEFLKTYKPRN